MFFSEWQNQQNHIRGHKFTFKADRDSILLYITVFWYPLLHQKESMSVHHLGISSSSSSSSGLFTTTFSHIFGLLPITLLVE